MEEKQLDFNAPLLSARRFSSPSRSMKGGKWNVTGETPSSRRHSIPLSNFDYDQEHVTKPVGIPFHWEQIPGKPKGEEESWAQRQEPSNYPGLPPGRSIGSLRYKPIERSKSQNLNRPQTESFSTGDHGHVHVLEKSKECVDSKDGSDTDSGDEAYSDALDTFSPTESWSLNYRVSGCQSSHMKSSGTPKIDQQTRDFMLKRFLPAAKSVVLETPQHVMKKQVVGIEQLKKVKKVVSEERKPLLKQGSCDMMPYFSRSEEDVERADDQESIIAHKRSDKACGILPWFCVKNSVCLVDPARGNRSKAPVSTPSRGEGRRLTRNSFSGPLEKNGSPAVSKKKFYSGVLPELLKDECKLTSGSYHLSHSCKPGASPLRRYRIGLESPYGNEAPQSSSRASDEIEYPNGRTVSSWILPKSMQNVPKSQTSNHGSGPPDDAIAKALFTDRMNHTESTKLNSCFKSEGLIRSSAIDKASQVMLDEEANLRSETAELSRAVLPSACTLKPDCLPARTDNCKLNQSLDQESRLLECSEAHSDAKVGKLHKKRELNPIQSMPLLPPPLPISPSESWLGRTLPSISLHNSFSHALPGNHCHPINQGRRCSTPITKRDNVVKASALWHDHV